MIYNLPQALLRRIPAGHEFHVWSGTLEHIRTQSGSGQRNFILHPIPGESRTALNVQEHLGVTDLPVEQFNGHRVGLYGFIDESGDVTFPLCYSRGTDAWLVLHDMHKLVYTFKPVGAKTSAKLFNAFFRAVAGPSSAALMPINPLNGKPMSGQEIHQLLTDIRTHLAADMANAYATDDPTL